MRLCLPIPTHNRPIPSFLPPRRFNSSSTTSSSPSPHTAIYRTHGRALLKSITLSFLLYQVAYWAFTTIEYDELKARKTEEVDGVEKAVRGMVGEREREETREEQKEGKGKEDGKK